MLQSAPFKILITLEFRNQASVESSRHLFPSGLASISPNQWLCAFDGTDGEKFYTLSELQVAKVLAAIENSIETNGVISHVR
jgi:hypothetical protein